MAKTELEKLGYELSKYAASSKLQNTPEFLEGLFELIERFQDMYYRSPHAQD